MPLHPSIFDGAQQMVTERKISICRPSPSQLRAANVTASLRRIYRRNVVFCSKAVHTKAWGFSQQESERVLRYLSKRSQRILFYDVREDGTRRLRGEITGDRWKRLHKQVQRFHLSGDFKITPDLLRPAWS